MEARKVKSPIFSARCEHETNAWVALVNVKQTRFEPIPVVLLHLVSIGKGPKNISVWPLILLTILLLAVIANGTCCNCLTFLLLLNLLVEHLHEIFEILVRLYIRQVLAHYYIAELIVAVEVVANLLDEASLTHVLGPSDVHHWTRI